MSRPIGTALLLALLAGLGASPVLPAHAADPAVTATVPAPSSLFVVIYRPGPSWQAGRPMREQGLLPHGRYMRSLFDDGRLFAGGGFVGSDGGLAILRAADLEAARAIIAVDPAVTSGIFVADVEQWRPQFQSAEPLPARPQAAAGSR